MAIIAEVETTFGEKRECYIRLNNIEASNHGMTSTALFRGFLSKEAFEAGKIFVWERQIDFQSDVGKALWKQAYAALQNSDFAPDQREEYAGLVEQLAKLNEDLEVCDEDGFEPLQIEISAQRARLAELVVAIKAADELAAAVTKGKEV